MSDDVRVRQSTEHDIGQMSALLRALTAAGMRVPGRDDEAFVRDQYVLRPSRVSCAVAEVGGDIAGLQVLSLARPGEGFDVPVGWGVIGTHVSLTAHRLGIGRALFEVTREAGRAAGVRTVDATIGADNAGGLAYYEAMGFRTYEVNTEVVRKRYDYRAS